MTSTVHNIPFVDMMSPKRLKKRRLDLRIILDVCPEIDAVHGKRSRTDLHILLEVIVT